MFFRGKPALRRTVVGQNGTIEGTLRTDDDVHVGGTVRGSVTSDGHVVIRRTGLVEGDVIGDTVEVAGRVEGTVTARTRLRMAATGAICGDAHYESLEVERGGVIEGRARRLTEREVPALPAPAVKLADLDGRSVRPPLRRPERDGLRSSIAFAEDPEEGYGKGGTQPVAIPPPPVPTFEAPRVDETCDYQTADPADLVSLQSSEEHLH